jgi:hypothetical protein
MAHAEWTEPRMSNTFHPTTPLDIVGTLVAGCAIAALLAGCGKGTESAGGKTAGSVSPTTATSANTAPATTAPTPAGTESTSPSFAMPAYGVQPTTTRALAPGEVTCEFPAGASNTVDATGTAAGSPTVILAVPEGFSTQPGTDDTALKLTGPGGMTATVTISPTTLDAQAAFQQYADQRTAGASINSLSVLPGEVCEYSGQELMGILADRPGEEIDYADRVVHVWTGDGDFLIAVRLEAPNKTPGFDTAKSALLTDLGIRMP